MACGGWENRGRRRPEEQGFRDSRTHGWRTGERNQNDDSTSRSIDRICCSQSQAVSFDAGCLSTRREDGPIGIAQAHDLLKAQQPRVLPQLRISFIAKNVGFSEASAREARAGAGQQGRCVRPWPQQWSYIGNLTRNLYMFVDN